MIQAELFTNPKYALVTQRVNKIYSAIRQFQLPPHPDSHEIAEWRIGTLARQTDFECAILGGLGFGNDVIRRRTGLSNSQIYYRLKAAGISRRAYREGRSPFALSVLEKASKQAALFVQANVRRLEAQKDSATKTTKTKSDYINV